MNDTTYANSDQSKLAVLLLSVDGLKPEYVLKADDYGLEIPHLRKMLTEGAYATRVKGVLPANTFPGHITLITGVSPALHGIYHNRPFDPPARTSGDRWDWLNEHIQVPTLWTVAAAAGLRTAGVGWPGSVGAGDIHDNIPERVVGSTNEEVWSVVTPGLIDLMGEAAEACIEDGSIQIANYDWERTCYALEIMRNKAPDLLAVHLAAGDAMQHGHGPFSAPAFEAYEEIDRMIGILSAAFHEVNPGAVVVVASDHGFSEVNQVLRLDAALEREGLLSFESRESTYSDSEVADWVALHLPAGGSAPVFLKDPNDDEAREQVGNFLNDLAGNSDHGIASILDKEEIARLGGTPKADFWIDFEPGVTASQHLDGALTAPRDPRGTHGYSPIHREMDSALFISGEGIQSGLSLGHIDIRNIAPTIARVLGVALPTAELPYLEIFETP